jgi:hypothetical protein
VIRFLATIAALLFLMPAAVQGITCTGCSLTGVRVQKDKTADYILVIGDPQIGGQCAYSGGSITHWATAFDSTGTYNLSTDHQLCGQAQVNETAEMIEWAFDKYPIGLAVIEGDLVDTTGGWQIEAVQAMIGGNSFHDGLSANIRSKLRWVGGNHDAASTNCSKMARYLSTKFDTTGSVSDVFWSERLNHTRLIGFQSSLISNSPVEMCQMQETPSNALSAVTPGNPRCYGDDTQFPARSTAAEGSCTADSDCKSGTCLLSESMYPVTMNFIADEIAKFNSSRRDEVLIMNMHHAICRDGVNDCPYDATDDGHAFDRMTNLLTCGSGTDAGKYCDISGSYTCVGGDAICTTERTNFRTRTTILAGLATIPTSGAFAKSGFVQATGHVGGSTPRASSNLVLDSSAPGIPYLNAEVVGAWSKRWETDEQWGAVVLVEHGQAPRVIEYYPGVGTSGGDGDKSATVNNAPELVLSTVGSISMAATATHAIAATDADYGSVDYYWGTREPAGGSCVSLDQLNTGVKGDITANIETDACAASEYGPFDICVTDNGVASVSDPSAGGKQDCEDITITVS